ncbi:hypothetical protein [Parasphingorhabdus sp.]|uniref:hypothetical protein n=1 Tax=Parasphingorhabdus sp. TaxID=2709688 RepID=UPI003BAFC02E
MNDFATSLDNVRRHNSIVEEMEFALKNDPENRKLRMGLGSAKRRAAESEKNLNTLVSANSIDLIRYKIDNGSDTYAVKSVTESVSGFQNSFTGVVDFLENGPKDKAHFSNEIKNLTELGFAYTFPGSLGVVLSVSNDRDLIEGKFDRAVDVFEEFLEISNSNMAVDASRHMGLALVSQLCSWIKVNSQWGNSVDYIWNRSDGIVRGQHVGIDHFHQLNDIFQSAKEEEQKQLEIQGILVGLDLETSSFHFVVKDGDDYRGKLDDQFQKGPTVVGREYTAQISKNETRKVATGNSIVTYKLLHLS